MRVLVAADRDSLGAVLVSMAREAGHQVDGLELGWYEGCHPGVIGASHPIVDIRCG
jgi:hypothetical protein